MITTNKPEHVLTVSEYIDILNEALKHFKAKVAGEVTEVEVSSRGHVYFSIKDKAGSVLRCVVWKSNYKMFGVKLEQGLEVVLAGSADIYAPLGKLSFVTESIALKGEGLLKKAYEALKKKLTEEGVFSEARKRPLPEFPQRVGVITSKYGAAIHDLLSNLGKFGFKVSMIDSRVEGQEAVKDLLSALKTFRKQAIDVLVIMRGGGSLESLQAFNNEVLVRAIVDFPVAVVAAIGHEKDVPLLALAADASVSTPTAAANLLNRSWQAAPLKINQYERFIFERFQQDIFQTKQRIRQLFDDVSANLAGIFRHFRDLEQSFKGYLLRISQGLKENSKYLADHGLNAITCFERQFKDIVQKLYLIKKTILANSPEKNLGLGYCIARKNKRVVRSVDEVAIGENIDLQVKDGSLNTRVNNKRHA